MDFLFSMTDYMAVIVQDIISRQTAPNEK